MLPKEHITERVLELDKKLEKTSIEQLETLVKDDFALIGRLISQFTYIDFNLRRLALCFAKREKLKSISNMCDLVKPHIEHEFHEYLDEIILRFPIRNMLAHWIAKRIPNEDALVLFTTDIDDSKRTIGKRPQPDLVPYAIYDLADLRGLSKHLEKYEQWIAEQSAKFSDLSPK